ncbi:MAG: tetratricopeptide repeat protein [Proteobacteria bacterium]|nr:tetratricopeptide repeat protein [Pseudomonadota bacterium]
MSGSAPGFIVEAGRLLGLRRAAQAIRCCRHGLLGDPQCVEGRLLLALALLAAGQYDEALAQVDAVQAFEADHPLAELLRAEALLLLGSVARAEQALLRARALGAAVQPLEHLLQQLAVQRAAARGARRGAGARVTNEPDGADASFDDAAAPVASGAAPTAEVGWRQPVSAPCEELDQLLRALRLQAVAALPVATLEIATQEVTSNEQLTGLYRRGAYRPVSGLHEVPTRELVAPTAGGAPVDGADAVALRGALDAVPTAVVPDAARRAAAHDLAFQQTMRGPLRPPLAHRAGGRADDRRAVESAAVESAAVESVAVESVAVESAAVESVAVESAAVESVAVEPVLRAFASATGAPAELTAQEIETVSHLLAPRAVVSPAPRKGVSEWPRDLEPIELTDSAVEIALADPLLPDTPEPAVARPAEPVGVPVEQRAPPERRATGLTTSAPVALQEAEISLVLPAPAAWTAPLEEADQAGPQSHTSALSAGGAVGARGAVATWDPLANAAPQPTEALERSQLLARAEGPSGARSAQRAGSSSAASVAARDESAGPRSQDDSRPSARSWGSRSAEASAGGSQAPSSLGRSVPRRRFRAPSAAFGRRPRTGWWTLIAGDRSAQRWALVLIGCIAVVTLALLVGFLVRGYRLRQLSALRLEAARLRVERGNLADYTASAQLLGATGGAGSGGAAVQHLHARLVAAIPIEFGDRWGAAPAPIADGAWEDDEEAAAAVYLRLVGGQLDQAEALAARALRSFPESALLLYLRGRLALLRGEPERAQQWLMQATQRAPRAVLFAAALGEALRGRAEPSLALQQYQRALQLNRVHVASALGRARCLLELERLADAGRQLQQVLHGELRAEAARGQQAWAFLLLGNLHRVARDPDEARRDLQQARSLAPATDPVFLEELAWALMAVDRVGEAETAAAAAAALMPGRPRAALLSATVLLREGRLQEAWEQAQRASTLAEAALVRAEVEFRLGRVEQAARELQSWPVVASSPAGQLLAARVAAARGESEDALAAARELAASQPDQVEALTVVGGLLLAEGRLGEARRALEQALRHDADALEPRLALVQVMLGEHALTAARDELVRLVGAYPWSTIATKRLAELDLGRHDLLAARKATEALLQRVPHDDEAQLLLVRVRVAGYELEAAEQQLLKIDRGVAGQRDLATGRLALAADDGRRAVGHLLAAVRALPHDRSAWSLLVQAYLAVDRPDRARQAWQSMLRRFPRAWQTYETQGRLELSAARPHAAVLALRQAIALAADQVRYPAEQAATEVLLGVALQDGGDLRQALEALTRAETACPLCPEPPFRRGLALQELRRQPEAVGALVRAVRLSPRMPQVYYALGKLYQSLERRTEALRMYRQYLELNPPEELADDVRRAMAELQR